MKRLLAILFAAALAATIASGQHEYVGMGDGAVWPSGHVRAANTEVDTFVWVFQPPWLASSSNPNYPASPDSVVSYGFKYFWALKADSTVQQYDATYMQVNGILADNNLYNNCFLLLYFPFNELPRNVDIVDARMYLKGAVSKRPFSNNCYTALDTVDTYDMLEVDESQPYYPNSTYQYADSTAMQTWPLNMWYRTSIDKFGPYAYTPCDTDTISTNWVSLNISAIMDTFEARARPFAALSPFVAEHPNTPYKFAAGPSAPASDQPFVVLKCVHKNIKPWYGKQLAFVWMQDDIYKCDQKAWLDTLDVLGYKASLAVAKRTVGLSSCYWDASELDSLVDTGTELVFHSTWHGNPDGDSYAAQYGVLRYEDCDSMRAACNPDSLEAATGIAKSNYRYFAYPNYRYTPTVVDTLLSLGLLGARTGGKGSTTTNWALPYGSSCAGATDSTTLAPVVWDGQSNIYAAAIYCEIKKIVGTDAESPGQETIEARVDSVINDALQRGDYPIIILYTHDSKTHTGWPNGIENDEFGWMMRRFLSSPHIKPLKFSEAFDWYRQHHHPVPGLGREFWR